MDDNKFRLWKLALSTIHIDGKVTEEEIKWFKKTIKSLEENSVLKLSSDQIENLKDTLKTPVINFVEEFQLLNKPADSAFVLHILRIVSHVDSDFSTSEKAMYKTLEQACLKGVDIKAIDAKTDLMEEESYHEKNVYSTNNKSSRFESIFKQALCILNPGDYKIPK